MPLGEFQENLHLGEGLPMIRRSAAPVLPTGREIMENTVSRLVDQVKV
jgi:hypothetical protein